VAALALARNPSLTARQVGDLLRSTARPLRDNPGDPVPNKFYGAGMVQADAAARAAFPVPVAGPAEAVPAEHTNGKSTLPVADQAALLLANNR
jgi:hypothetical protein